MMAGQSVNPKMYVAVTSGVNEYTASGASGATASPQVPGDSSWVRLAVSASWLYGKPVGSITNGLPQALPSISPGGTHWPAELHTVPSAQGSLLCAYRPVDPAPGTRSRATADEPPKPEQTQSSEELILTAEHLEQYRQYAHPTERTHSHTPGKRHGSRGWGGL